MKVIIPAAGYGTRLDAELTVLPDKNNIFDAIRPVWRQNKGVAKALIPIQNKPLIQHLVEQLISSGVMLGDVFIVTNDLFYQWFVNWAQSFDFPQDNIINDKTMSNKTRLGSNHDIALAVKQGQIDDDLLIMASDTLFKNLDLRKFLNFCATQNNSVITYYEELPERMTKHGNLVINDDFLIDFVEKPAVPISNFAFPSLSFLKKEHLPLLVTFLQEALELAQNDGHGFFIRWLIKRDVKIAAYKILGRFDLGTLADWQKAEQEYQL